MITSPYSFCKRLACLTEAVALYAAEHSPQSGPQPGSLPRFRLAPQRLFGEAILAYRFLLNILPARDLVECLLPLESH